MNSLNLILRRMLPITALTLGLCAFACVEKAQAYETDQYTLPTQQLQDVGPYLSKFVVSNLYQTVKEFEALGYRPSEKELLIRFHKKISGSITWQEQRDGVFGAELTLFDGLSKSQQSQILFDPGKTKNVFSFAGFHRVISPTYFVFSSTMKSYGVYHGVDKLGHFINQGFQYWEKNLEFRQQGDSAMKAESKVIAWGDKTESGLFGKIVDGVYSNADLAANYAGFKFYQNLFKDLELPGVYYHSLLVIDPRTGLYTMNWDYVGSGEDILKPFFTEHFNEALNPSVLERPMRAVVRIAIKNRCQAWKKFNSQWSAQDIIKLETDLVKWNGYHYGNDKKNRLLLSEICF